MDISQAMRENTVAHLDLLDLLDMVNIGQNTQSTRESTRREITPMETILDSLTTSRTSSFQSVACLPMVPLDMVLLENTMDHLLSLNTTALHHLTLSTMDLADSSITVHLMDSITTSQGTMDHRRLLDLSITALLKSLIIINQDTMDRRHLPSLNTMDLLTMTTKVPMTSLLHVSRALTKIH